MFLITKNLIAYLHAIQRNILIKKPGNAPLILCMSSFKCKQRKKQHYSKKSLKTEERRVFF